MKFLIVEPSPRASFLGPNIRLWFLFSNYLSLRSSLNVRDHDSHPHSTTGNIIVKYIYIYPLMLKSYTVLTYCSRSEYIALRACVPYSEVLVKGSCFILLSVMLKHCFILSASKFAWRSWNMHILYCSLLGFKRLHVGHGYS